MIIARLIIKFYLPGCSSLKEKRYVLRSVRDKLGSRFNVAFCETGFQDKWQRSEFCLVTVANTRRGLDRLVQSLISFLEASPGLICTDIEREYL
ncbi:MAG: DUF503 family protein [Candidatus Latescibacteria bacterium]|nr:DUF503 family protein [bacterium]MBD3424563.1 DUF503 family protein [Candidatus Latescibacterota bacterium]